MASQLMQQLKDLTDDEKLTPAQREKATQTYNRLSDIIKLLDRIASSGGVPVLGKRRLDIIEEFPLLRKECTRTLMHSLEHEWIPGQLEGLIQSSIHRVKSGSQEAAAKKYVQEYWAPMIVETRSEKDP